MFKTVRNYLCSKCRQYIAGKKLCYYRIAEIRLFTFILHLVTNLHFFPENLDSISKEQDECFHQDLMTFKVITKGTRMKIYKMINVRQYVKN